MIRTTEEARHELRKLNFPEIFDQFLRQEIPLSLVGTCGPVILYFELLTDLAKMLPACQFYVPLWETNLEAVVAYDLAHNSFVRYYYGRQSAELIGKTYQQFISSILLDLVDSGIWDELEDLAESFRYNHLERLRSFAKREHAEDFQHVVRSFVSSIPD